MFVYLFYFLGVPHSLPVLCRVDHVDGHRFQLSNPPSIPLPVPSLPSFHFSLSGGEPALLGYQRCCDAFLEGKGLESCIGVGSIHVRYCLVYYFVLYSLFFLGLLTLFFLTTILDVLVYAIHVFPSLFVYYV